MTTLRLARRVSAQAGWPAPTLGLPVRPPLRAADVPALVRAALDECMGEVVRAAAAAAAAEGDAAAAALGEGAGGAADADTAPESAADADAAPESLAAPESVADAAAAPAEGAAPAGEGGGGGAASGPGAAALAEAGAAAPGAPGAEGAPAPGLEVLDLDQRALPVVGEAINVLQMLGCARAPPAGVTADALRAAAAWRQSSAGARSVPGSKWPGCAAPHTLVVRVGAAARAPRWGRLKQCCGRDLVVSCTRCRMRAGRRAARRRRPPSGAGRVIAPSSTLGRRRGGAQAGLRLGLW